MKQFWLVVRAASDLQLPAFIGSCGSTSPRRVHFGHAADAGLASKNVFCTLMTHGRTQLFMLSRLDYQREFTATLMGPLLKNAIQQRSGGNPLSKDGAILRLLAGTTAQARLPQGPLDESAQASQRTQALKMKSIRREESYPPPCERSFQS